MAKTQARTTAKKPAKAKLAVRKVALKDLTSKQTELVKGGPLSGRQRCF